MAAVVPELQIGAKLGEGHFGEVFLAQHNIHGHVAVKVLSRRRWQSDDVWRNYKKNFLAEAQKLSRASHAHVVQVFDIHEADDDKTIHYCMAYCPGGSLQSEFDKGQMLLSDVRKVITEVLLGLEALHKRDMLHRDIKPGNILLDANGTAKLGDFGLVTDDLVLGYGSQAGYADHVAIEVWNTGLTSAKSDIWALGMTMYRLLHGRAWYEESPPPSDLIRGGKFAHKLDWLPHVPKSWRRVLRKMLNDDTDARYQNCNQVLNALSDLETPAWRTSVTPDLVRWEQDLAKRRRVVEWIRHSERKHEWKAWSEPLAGTGRAMTLGGSTGVVSKRQAIQELETYFAS